MLERIAVAAGLLGLGIATTAPGQARSPFDDLPSLGVHVLGITVAAARAGVDSGDLHRRVERQLLRAGFRVAGAAELAERPETPRLVVNLGFFTTDSSAVYSVLLELLELVHLKRNGFETHAVGWSEQALGIAPRGRSGDATRKATAALVDLFLSRARSANRSVGGGGR